MIRESLTEMVVSSNEVDSVYLLMIKCPLKEYILSLISFLNPNKTINATINTARPKPMLITAIRLIIVEKEPVLSLLIRFRYEIGQIHAQCKEGFSILEEQTNLVNYYAIPSDHIRSLPSGVAHKTMPRSQQWKFFPVRIKLRDYITLLLDKRMGLTVNHSSIIGSTHLTDSLLGSEVMFKKVFTPEHGFKGTISDGKQIEYDDESELPFELISLYGKNKKPTIDQMEGLDMMIFDIQDVGTRFYTYISTMHYVMEACAENDIPLIILDRPNPNGSYVDGPVLDTAFRSFVGCIRSLSFTE